MFKKSWMGRCLIIALMLLALGVVANSLRNRAPVIAALPSVSLSEKENLLRLPNNVSVSSFGLSVAKQGSLHQSMNSHPPLSLIKVKLLR